MNLRAIAQAAIDEAAKTAVFDISPRNPDFESKHPRGRGKFVQKFENFAKADIIPDSGNRAVRGQIRSPAFKQWFGDWENDPANASKIVDSRGRPLVVWHGSPNTDFTTFDKRKIHPKYGIRGFYFAPPKRRDSLAGYYGEGKERPFYLNIRNPLVCGPDYKPSKKELAEHDGIIRVYDDDEPWEKTFFNYRKDKMDTEIQRKGDIIEIVAFEPNQIKSADSNSGAFSPESKSTLDSATFSPAAFLNYLAGEKKN